MTANAASARQNRRTLRAYGRRVGAVLWMLACWCILGGWSYTTKDIRRPLIADPETLPRKLEDAQPMAGGGIPRESVEKSLSITRNAIDYFGICKYDDSFNL